MLGRVAASSRRSSRTGLLTTTPAGAAPSQTSQCRDPLPGCPPPPSPPTATCARALLRTTPPATPPPGSWSGPGTARAPTSLRVVLQKQILFLNLSLSGLWKRVRTARAGRAAVRSQLLCRPRAPVSAFKALSTGRTGSRTGEGTRGQGQRTQRSCVDILFIWKIFYISLGLPFSSLCL